MADVKLQKTVPFLATQRSRTISAEAPAVADGTYDVLATLSTGSQSYRILAELRVHNGEAQLRFFRFEVPGPEEWFSERRMVVPVSRPEIAPLPHKIMGAAFVLCTPLRLDEVRAVAVFGASGPPAT